MSWSDKNLLHVRMYNIHVYINNVDVVHYEKTPSIKFKSYWFKLQVMNMRVKFR